MKKILVISAIVVGISVGDINAQNIRAFVTLGGNLSQIEGDEVSGFKKPGLTASVGTLIPMSKSEQWLLSIETKFSQYGAYEKSYPYHYNATLPYIEIPVLAHFDDPIGKWTFGLGLSYGRLLNYTEKAAWDVTGVTTIITDFEKKEFLKNDLSFVADIRFGIWKNLKFNFRYQQSLLPVKKDWLFTYHKGTEIQDAYNMSLSVRLIWVFNDKDTSKKTQKGKKRK